MVVSLRKLKMREVRALVFGILVAVPALQEACTRQPELRILRNMPTVVEAVVAPETGRLFPSAAGPGHEIVIPENALALSATLAEVRASVAPEETKVTATIAPGDRVEVLVNDDNPRGLCLIRTEAKTYCWLSTQSLVVTTEN